VWRLKMLDDNIVRNDTGIDDNRYVVIPFSSLLAQFPNHACQLVRH
jgi:hypothetical protein